MIISQNIIERIIDHAKREAPIEACGYLVGTDDRIIEVYVMKNIDGREDHFSFDPQEQFAAHKNARQAGLKIIGIYHSHPVTPARPSAEDIRLAAVPTYLYVIVSLMEDLPAVKGFWIKERTVTEEPLMIEDKP